MQINSAKELDVYQAAYDLAMRIFELTKHFPAEERFALTSQIRRSSRRSLSGDWQNDRQHDQEPKPVPDLDPLTKRTDH